MVAHVQVSAFLVEWRLPDCEQCFLPILHQLKAQAGLVEKEVRKSQTLGPGELDTVVQCRILSGNFRLRGRGGNRIYMPTHTL